MTDHDEIEILDVAIGPASGSTESAADQGGSRWLPLAMVAVLGLGVAGLAVSGGDEAAAPATTGPAPSVTTPNTVPTTPFTLPDEADPSLRIGDGPVLGWQVIEVETSAIGFRWFDDGFLGLENDGSAALIRPSAAGGTLTLITGADNDSPVRSSEPVIGEPAANPTLLRFLGGPDIAIEAMTAPASDLLLQSVEVSTERIGDRILVLQTARTELDAAIFRERTGTTLGAIFSVFPTGTELEIAGASTSERIPIADTELTADDIDALRNIGEVRHRLSISVEGGSAAHVDDVNVGGMARIAWIAAVGDEFVVGGDGLRRSGDGVQWEPVTDGLRSDQFGILGEQRRPGPDGVLAGLEFLGEELRLTTSADTGRTWRPLASPLDDVWTLTSAAPILAMTGWAGNPRPPLTVDWDILTPEFELSIDESDSSFELRTRAGEVELEGSLDDQASGFVYQPGATDLRFVDPETGVEITRIPLDILASAVASSRTATGDPQLVAFADLSAGDAVQEWSVQPVTAVFGPDALSVEFVPGDGWLLADVLTTAGRRFYVAPIDASN